MSDNRIVLGALPDGTNYGIMISKSGNNVLTCGDDALLLDSRAGYVQAALSGTISFAADSTPSITVSYSYTKAPMYFVRATGAYPAGYSTSATTTALTINRTAGGYGTAFTFFYVVYSAVGGT